MQHLDTPEKIDMFCKKIRYHLQVSLHAGGKINGEINFRLLDGSIKNFDELGHSPFDSAQVVIDATFED